MRTETCRDVAALAAVGRPSCGRTPCPRSGHGPGVDGGLAGILAPGKARASALPGGDCALERRRVAADRSDVPPLAGAPVANEDTRALLMVVAVVAVIAFGLGWWAKGASRPPMCDHPMPAGMAQLQWLQKCG